MAGNMFYASTQFVVLVALARLTSAEEVGRYALALALTAPLFMFLGLKLRQVQVTDARGHNRPADYYGLRFITSLVALAASCLIALLGGWPIETVLTVAAVGAFKAVEAQIDVLYGTIQRLSQMHLIARAQIYRGIVATTAFIATLWFTRSAAVGVAVMALVSVGLLVLNVGTVKALGVPTRMTFDRSVLISLTKLSFPLGASVALGSLIINVPRYFLEHFSGPMDLGIFAAVGYVLTAVGLVAGALGQTAAPRLANLVVARQGRHFNRLLTKLIAFGFALGCAGVVVAIPLGRPALGILFGSTYATEWRALVVLMVATVPQYVALFIGTAANALRMFRVEAPIATLTLAAVIVGSWLLIPQYGIMGAAWAVVLSQFVQLTSYGLLYLFRIRPAVMSLEQ